MVYNNAGINLRDGTGNQIMPDGSKFQLKTVAHFMERFYTCQGAIANMHFILMITSATQNVMSIPSERPVFIREYSSKMYGVLAYLGG